jgi:hypothetical protein
MPIKVLFINFHKPEVLSPHSNIEITEANLEQAPTLHDFHVILLDADAFFEDRWWQSKKAIGRVGSAKKIIGLPQKIEEQVTTGGLTFCLCGKEGVVRVGDTDRVVFYRESREQYEEKTFSNYVFCPVDLGIINESGDSFYPKPEELKYYSVLLKKIPLAEIEWRCHFSKLPSGTRVLATNRAGYPIFIEVPLGAGKLTMLPYFKDKSKAVTILVNEVLPQMIHEEEFTFMPDWLNRFSTPFEAHIKEKMEEIDKAKRLLYTKDKLLKKAVAFALEKLGFKVDLLPDGTMPDLRLEDEEKRAICEIKGHENTQSDRKDLLQLLGYSTEEGKEEKGIFICNHEYRKEPCDRSREAFTEGAIQLAEKNNLCLISAVDLHNALMQMLEEKSTLSLIKEIRDKIMNGSALVHLP